MKGDWELKKVRILNKLPHLQVTVTTIIVKRNSIIQYISSLTTFSNRPFPSCFEPHYGSEAKWKVFVMKIIFHSYANKTNFHTKSFAPSLAFIVRFTATWKWPIHY